MTNKPSWRDELRILLNDWVKRMVALGELNEPKRNGGFTLYECPDIEPFIQDLLDRKAREIEGLKKPESEHDGHETDSDGWCYTCTNTIKGDLTNNRPYNQALDQAISILKEDK